MTVCVATSTLLIGLFACSGAALALPSCDRLIDSGVRDCNLRLGLDSFELIDQGIVILTSRQLDRARRQRPLHELDPTPEQFGQIQTYCRRHGEVRRDIGIARGLCQDTHAD
jgi:hypothetical protein